MDGPRDYHIKWSQTETDKYLNTYMWNLKTDVDELIYKTEVDSQTKKRNLSLSKGKGGKG